MAEAICRRWSGLCPTCRRWCNTLPLICGRCLGDPEPLSKRRMEFTGASAAEREERIRVYEDRAAQGLPLFIGEDDQA